MGGLPYEVYRVSEDAQQFLNRMTMIDDKVAKHLNAIHQRRVDEVNEGRRENITVFKPGEKVWFRRCVTLSAGLYSIWEGPSVVLRRVGHGSYVISTP